jgi:hypothetical protein
MYKHLEKQKVQKNIVEALASVAVASLGAVERYVLNQEDPYSNEERESLEQILSQELPHLQFHIRHDNFGVLPPPKEDPSFELKHLPDDMKYAYLDVYLVIISANLSG